MRGSPSGLDRCGAPLPSALPRLVALFSALLSRGTLAPLRVSPGVVREPPWLSSVPAARVASVGQAPANSSSRCHGRHGRNRACSDIPALVPPAEWGLGGGRAPVKIPPGPALGAAPRPPPST